MSKEDRTKVEEKIRDLRRENWRYSMENKETIKSIKNKTENIRDKNKKLNDVATQLEKEVSDRELKQFEESQLGSRLQKLEVMRVESDRNKLLYEANAKTLQNELAKFKARSIRFKTDLDAARKNSAGLQQQVDEKSKEIAKLRERERNDPNFTERLKEMREAEANFQEELEDSQRREQRLRDEIQNVNNAKDELEEKYKTEQAKLKNQIDDLGNNLQETLAEKLELENKLRRDEGISAKNAGRILELEADNAKILDDLEKLQKRIETLQNQGQQKTEEYNKLYEQMMVKEAEVATLTQDLGEREFAIGEADEQLFNAKIDMKNLRLEIQNRDDEIETHKARLDEANHALQAEKDFSQDLAAQLTQRDNQIKTNNQQIAQKEQQLTERQKKDEQNTRRLQHLELQLRNKETQKSDLEEKLAEGSKLSQSTQDKLLNHIKAAEKEIQKLKAQTQKAEKVRDQELVRTMKLEADLDNIRAENRDLHGEIQRLKNEQDVMKKRHMDEIRAIQLDINQGGEEVARLREQLVEKEQEVQHLQDQANLERQNYVRSQQREEELQRQIEQLNQDKQALTDHTHQQEEQIHHLEEQQRHYRQNYTENREYQHVTELKNQAEAQLQETRERLADTERNVNDLTQKLQNLKDLDKDKKGYLDKNRQMGQDLQNKENEVQALKKELQKRNVLIARLEEQEKNVNARIKAQLREMDDINREKNTIIEQLETRIQDLLASAAEREVELLGSVVFSPEEERELRSIINMDIFKQNMDDEDVRIASMEAAVKGLEELLEKSKDSPAKIRFVETIIENANIQLDLLKFRNGRNP